jgi:hypothetical protein
MNFLVLAFTGRFVREIKLKTLHAAATSLLFARAIWLTVAGRFGSIFLIWLVAND